MHQKLWISVFQVTADNLGNIYWVNGQSAFSIHNSIEDDDDDDDDDDDAVLTCVRKLTVKPA